MTKEMQETTPGRRCRWMAVGDTDQEGSGFSSLMEGVCFLWSGRMDLGVGVGGRFSISHVALKVPTDIQAKSHRHWT